MSRRAFLVTAGALLAGAAGWAVIRRLGTRPPSDEELIGALFLDAARAVEEKRVSDAVRGVSERFRGDGLSKHELKQVIAVHSLRGEWVSVTVAGTRLRVDGDAAEGTVDVVMARSGKGRSLADLLPAEASASRIACRLEREEGEWRVVAARRRPISLAEALAGPAPAAADP
jgi:hypothetical protein